MEAETAQALYIETANLAAEKAACDSALRHAVPMLREAGYSERAIAKVTRLDRRTVRKLLGK